MYLKYFMIYFIFTQIYFFLQNLVLKSFFFFNLKILILIFSKNPIMVKKKIITGTLKQLQSQKFGSSHTYKWMIFSPGFSLLCKSAKSYARHIQSPSKTKVIAVSI